MPNHITNRLTVHGTSEKVAEVFNFLKANKPNKNGEVILVDFNKNHPDARKP